MTFGLHVALWPPPGTEKSTLQISQKDIRTSDPLRLEAMLCRPTQAAICKLSFFADQSQVVILYDSFALTAYAFFSEVPSVALPTAY